jgi:hypothetical protein
MSKNTQKPDINTLGLDILLGGLLEFTDVLHRVGELRAQAKLPETDDNGHKKRFTAAQAADFLGIGKSTLKRRRDDGKITPTKVDGILRYDREELERYRREYGDA